MTRAAARIRFGTLGLTVVLSVLPALVAAQAARTPRDAWQRVDDVAGALGVSPGEVIADVGAGTGFFSFRLSPKVGPQGRVLAVDIDARVLREVQETAARDGYTNIETIVSRPDDPLLPDRSVDGILVVNSYHEMQAYEAMLAGFRRALRPDGRLVIIDMPPRDSTVPRRRQVMEHDIAIGLVAAELEAAGFHVIDRQPDFVTTGRQQQWMLVAVVAQGRRP